MRLDPSCHSVGGMRKAVPGLRSHRSWGGERAPADNAPGHDKTGQLKPGKYLGPRILEGAKEHWKGSQEARPTTVSPGSDSIPTPQMLQMVLSSSEDRGVPLCPIYRPGQAGNVLAYQPRASGETKTQQKLAPPTASFTFSSSLGPARCLPRSAQEGQTRRCTDDTAQGRAPRSCAGVSVGQLGSAMGGLGEARPLGLVEGQKLQAAEDCGHLTGGRGARALLQE